MGLISKMADTIRKGLRDFLSINSTSENTIVISEGVDFLASCAKNRIWYIGKSNQLTELYRQLDVPSTMFWKAPMTKGREIRKIHIPLPSLMVDTVANIVMSDFNGIEVSDENGATNADLWNEIAIENEFSKILKKAVKDIGIVGDGAFKISYDIEISDKPIIEWFPAERVKFVYERGRIREIIFYTNYYENNKKYQLAEYYGYGYIKYELYNSTGKQISLNSINKTSRIKGDGVSFDKKLIWGVPVIFGQSSLYEGRGKGFIEDKEDEFDSLDEVWSQWMDALRAGRTKEYIPECFIPHNEETGEMMKPNPFDNRFIAIANGMSDTGKENRIYTETPPIQHESYLSSYVTALDLCLQGVLSPTTLGIDTKKLDNADAQREKEKTTLYTRQDVIELLEKVLPQLVSATLNADYSIHNKPIIDDIESSVKFGEYANPSFESQVETIGKARQNVIMSIEASIDELYGDSKSDEWKTEEVRRIKEELGIAEVEETSELNDVTPIGF
ncbi:MAG: phage portal protein [Ruminococcus sp.]|nr:phage portal protein [Ruminococcus sp.]